MVSDYYERPPISEAERVRRREHKKRNRKRRQVRKKLLKQEGQ